jgi:hypothetical protein
MGRVVGLVFGSYIESVEFREAMVKLVAYAVVFAIGYHLNLVFGDDRIAPLLDGYAMTRSLQDCSSFQERWTEPFL